MKSTIVHIYEIMQELPHSILNWTTHNNWINYKTQVIIITYLLKYKIKCDIIYMNKYTNSTERLWGPKYKEWMLECEKYTQRLESWSINSIA